MRLAAAILILASGCSLVFSRPPRLQRDGSFECTPGTGAPLADVVLGGASGITALAIVATTPNPDQDSIVWLPLLLYSALHLGSAVRGFGDTRVCREACKDARNCRPS